MLASNPIYFHAQLYNKLVAAMHLCFHAKYIIYTHTVRYPMHVMVSNARVNHLLSHGRYLFSNEDQWSKHAV